MERHRGPSALVIGLHFILATILLYLGLATYLLTPVARDEGLLSKAAPLFFVLPTLVVTFRMAWITRRPESPQSKGRSLWLTLPLSCGGVLLAAVLILVIRWHSYWADLFGVD